MNVLVVNGPNLNLLGEREPDVYGRLTLRDLERAVRERARRNGQNVRFFQSNHEGAIIDELHRLRHWADCIVINPGAFTHYSYAIRDALAAIALPATEVHLSDVDNREEFRKISVIRDVCTHRFAGRGVDSYLDALDAFAALAALRNDRRVAWRSYADISTAHDEDELSRNYGETLHFEQMRGPHGEVVEYDRAATVRAYRRFVIEHVCECIMCRNYRAAFDARYHDPLVRELAARLGIDMSKPGEITGYVFDRTKQLTLYDGEYPFVGFVSENPTNPGFPNFTNEPIHIGFAPPLVADPGLRWWPAALNFWIELPWVLEERPPDEKTSR